ncbi:MAG: SDR family NAD(P)-dependent oxidoreductase [Chloroflexi bacterium]|nr:SDR family NAD(P)-dependent oxidoreductase [Chloroflexota bacterium]
MFTGKVAIVTGASRGIGRALALALAREGATVICTARTLDGPPERGSLSATVQHIEREGGNAVAIACDVGDAASVKATVDQTLSQFSRIDLLINNAGVFPNNNTVDTEPEEWNATVAVNVTGPFLFCRYVLPGMIEQRNGNILNFTSQLANMARPGRAAQHIARQKQPWTGSPSTWRKRSELMG